MAGRCAEAPNAACRARQDGVQVSGCDALVPGGDNGQIPCRSAITTVAILAVYLSTCLAQFGMPDLPDTKPQAVKTDVQYISCQTCKAMVNQAYKVAQGMRKQLAGAQKVSARE